MVELTLDLDLIFGSLSHHIRRDILKRAAKKELSVSELAKPYKMTLAAISKHLKILEKARLIIKHRRGKEQIVELSPVAFQDATKYLEQYEKMWNDRFDSLEKYLSTFPTSSWISSSPASSMPPANACGRSGPSLSISKSGGVRRTSPPR